MVKTVEDVDFAKIEEVLTIYFIILKEWLDNMRWCFAEDASERIELLLDSLNTDEWKKYLNN